MIVHGSMDTVYVDVHTHLNAAAFDCDRDAVVLRTREAGVVMVNVGTQFDTSTRAVELAEGYGNGVYAAVGLHPVHTSPSHHDEAELGEFGKAFTSRGESFSIDRYRTLAQSPKVVAIGECGLDYYRVLDEASHRRQREAFEAQIDLANELGKPLMLHLRSGNGKNAYREAQDILKHHAKVVGNSHFFAGSLEDAHAFWDMGYSTSFTGVITFTCDYDEVIRAAPVELIHAETDAPYVAPVPHRGERNEPRYVAQVVERMATIRRVSTEELTFHLVQNARHMFGVSDLS